MATYIIQIPSTATQEILNMHKDAAILATIEGLLLRPQAAMKEAPSPQVALSALFSFSVGVRGVGLGLVSSLALCRLRSGVEVAARALSMLCAWRALQQCDRR